MKEGSLSPALRARYRISENAGIRQLRGNAQRVVFRRGGPKCPPYGV